MPRTKEQFEEIRKTSRQKILNAALKVFATEGYHSATVGKIAKSAGVAQGLLYNYFKSKEEVLYELMIGIMGNEMRRFLSGKPGAKFTKKDVEYIINTGIDLVLENPDYWKLYFSVFVQPDVLAMVTKKVMKMAEPYMKSLINYYKEKGEKDPLTMVKYFSAVMDGLQLHCMLDPKNFPTDKIKKMLIKQFV